MAKKLTITDRLIKIEVLIENHLNHHSMWIKFFLFPILVIVLGSFLLQLLPVILKAIYGG